MKLENQLVFTTFDTSLHSSIDTQGFFHGWPDKPDKETFLRILDQSYLSYIALDGNRLIGFVTSISDGVLSAYIPLLEVLPDYQGQGIGKRLVTEMLKALEDHYMIDLTCDDDLKAFYKHFDMKESNAMILRNYTYQKGKPSS